MMDDVYWLIRQAYRTKPAESPHGTDTPKICYFTEKSFHRQSTIQLTT